MLEIVHTYIKQYYLLPDSGTIVVAVSGGADSLCLLHLLQQLCGAGKPYPAVRLHVAHLDHQLRAAASAQDAAIVEHMAEMWGLPITIGTIDVAALAQQEHRSLEDAARTARYRFLREVAQGMLIAVAHHADDQVETLLLHWLRGGGMASMVGLQPLQQDIIRPLLAMTRADILSYCSQHNLTPLEDASNTDPRFLRNRIRHELLPLLETMNSGFRATLLRNAEVLQVDLAWIEQQVDLHWPTVVVSTQGHCIQLHRRALLALPLSLQRHLLRRATALLYGGQSPLELRHYKLIEQLLQRNSKDKELLYHLPQHLHIVRAGENILLERVPERESATGARQEGCVEVLLPIPGCVTVPGTPWRAIAEVVSNERLRQVQEALQHADRELLRRSLAPERYVVYIDSERVGDSLLIRTRRPGDRMRPLGMAHEKKVQDILIDRHITRSEREQIPLFFSAAHCIWLAGICIDDRVRLTSDTRGIVRLSLMPEEAVP
jgi:tRNA(Ile)-lysidine synthase